MAITESTIKRLCAKSSNKCAMPKCSAKLVVGDVFIGEIAHIKARNKKGPRYDAALSAEDKDSLSNLVLLCPTCHTLVDKSPQTYSVDLLMEIKEIHERAGDCELSEMHSRMATAIFTSMKSKRRVKISIKVDGDGNAVATGQGIAVAAGKGSKVTIDASKGKQSRQPKNSIGADANLKGYIEYLMDLWVKYMSPIGAEEGQLFGRIGRQFKNHFRLRSRTRNDLPAEKFDDACDFLVGKLRITPVGKKHTNRGTKLYSSFDEWRNGRE